MLPAVGAASSLPQAFWINVVAVSVALIAADTALTYL
jgi:hypothetical protein